MADRSWYEQQVINARFGHLMADAIEDYPITKALYNLLDINARVSEAKEELDRAKREDPPAAG